MQTSRPVWRSSRRDDARNVILNRPLLVTTKVSDAASKSDPKPDLNILDELSSLQAKISSVQALIEQAENWSPKSPLIPVSEDDHESKCVADLLKILSESDKASSTQLQEKESRLLLQIISQRKSESELLRKKLDLLNAQITDTKKVTDLDNKKEHLAVKVEKEVKLDLHASKEKVVKRQQLKVEHYVEHIREVPRFKPFFVDTIQTVQIPVEIVKINKVLKDIKRDVPVIKYEDVRVGSLHIKQEKVIEEERKESKQYTVQTAVTKLRKQEVPVVEETLVHQNDPIKKPFKQDRLVIVDKKITKPHKLSKQSPREIVQQRFKPCPGREIMVIDPVKVEREEFVRQDKIVPRDVPAFKNAPKDSIVIIEKKVEKPVSVEQAKAVKIIREVQSEKLVIVDKQVTKKVQLSKPEAKEEIIDVIVEIPAPVEAEQHFPVETIKYVEKEVEVPIEKVVEHYRDRVVKVEQIVTKEVPVDIVLHKTTDTLVFHEPVVEVPVESIKYVDVVEEIHLEELQFREVDKRVEVEKVVVKDKDVDVTVQNLVESIVYEDRDVEVPVERIEYVEHELVDVEVERLDLREREVSIPSEKVKLQITQERLVPKDVMVDVPIEKIRYQKREVPLPVEKIVVKDRAIEVLAGSKVTTTIERPKLEKKTVEVPVEHLVIKEKEVEVPVEHAVFQDRVTEVPVERTFQVGVPFEQALEVPVDKIVHNENIVTVEKAVVHEVPLVTEAPYDRVIYEDRDQVVELAKIIEVGVPTETIMEVPVEVIKYEDRIVEIPVQSGIQNTQKVREVPVEVIHYEDKVIEVPIEKIVYKDKTVFHPVEKVIYKDREVRVPVEFIVVEETKVEVPVEFITEKPVANEFITTRTTQRAVPQETIFEHLKETFVHEDRMVDVPIEEVVYNENIVEIRQEEIVQKPVPMNMTFETVQERVVYEENLQHVPYTVVVPQFKDVDVPISKPIIKERPRHVNETKTLEVIKNEVVPNERRVEIPVERLQYKDRYVDVPVQTIRLLERQKKVEVAVNENTVIKRPKIQEQVQDVEVVNRIVFAENFFEEVPVNKVVFKDRVVDVPVETVTEVLVSEPREKKVEVEFIKYNEVVVDVPLLTPVFEDKVKPVNVEKVVFKDREVVVEVQRTLDHPVYEDRVVNVEMPKRVEKVVEQNVELETPKIDDSEVIKVPVEKIKYEDRPILFETVKLLHVDKQIPANYEVVRVEDVTNFKEVEKTVINRKIREHPIPRVNVLEIDEVQEKIVEVRVADVQLVNRVKEVPGQDRLVPKPVEKIVHVELQTYVPNIRRVPVPRQVSAEIAHENIKVEKKEVQLQVPVVSTKINEKKIDRNVQDLKIINHDVQKQLKVQKPSPEQKKRTEEQITRTQPYNNVSEFVDHEVTLTEEVPEHRSTEVAKSVFLKDRIVIERPVAIEILNVRPRSVDLIREVPVERVVEVEVPVQVEAVDGRGVLSLIMDLESRLEAQKAASNATHNRMLQELQDLGARLYAEQCRSQSLKETLRRKDPPPTVVKEVVKSVDVTTEITEVTNTAAVATETQQLLSGKVKTTEESLKAERDQLAKTQLELRSAVTNKLRMRHQLDRVLLRMQSLERQVKQQTGELLEQSQVAGQVVDVPIISTESASRSSISLPGNQGLSELEVPDAAFRISLNSVAPSPPASTIAGPPSNATTLSAAPTQPGSSASVKPSPP